MATRIYRFDEFRLDPARRELWRGDDELTLPPKAFGCLVHLVEHRDRAVGRDELIAAVWQKVNLADSVLGQAIVDARRALGENGEAHRYIQTVRGFGYRWAAPVVTVEAASERGNEVGRRSLRRWLLPGLLVLAGLTAGVVHLRRHADVVGAEDVHWRMGEGDVALVLPVTVEPEDQQSWIRFGVMELIAERLRDAGQPMVPSETVIALMRGLPARPDTEGLHSLTSATGARRVFAAHAKASGTRWRVSIQSRNAGESPLTAFAEADDVLQAAQLAADRIALHLDLMPAPEPAANTEPDLARLLRQIEAARLAQRHDVARELIRAADPKFQAHPEVRFQQARLDYYRLDFDAAETAFEVLLEETSAKRDRVLRARVLNGLGGVQYVRRNYSAAEAMWERAARLADQGGAPNISGVISHSLGLVALAQGRFDVARTRLAHARRLLENTGDARSLALADEGLGAIEAMRDRYTEALYYFERSADRLAALHELSAEIRVRLNMMEVQLGLLNPQAAAAHVSRLDALLAETPDPQIAAYGNLAKAALLVADGQTEAADGMLADVLRAIESGHEPAEPRLWALVLHAEQFARQGDLSRAAHAASQVVERTTPGNDIFLDDYRGRAWLILLRSRLREADLAAAAELTRDIANWAERSPLRASEIYAALAEAELAAAEHRGEAADTAFKHALSLADSGQVPVRLLQVAESYVPWLLDEEPSGAAAPERAFLIADRVAQYADRDYRAALLQLRVSHALGPASAWGAALAGAQSLAGERQIPVELLAPPRAR